MVLYSPSKDIPTHKTSLSRPFILIFSKKSLVCGKVKTKGTAKHKLETNAPENSKRTVIIPKANGYT